MLNIRPAEVFRPRCNNRRLQRGDPDYHCHVRRRTKTKSEQLRWFESHGPKHPIIVAELDCIVVGWACLTNGLIALPTARQQKRRSM